MLLGSFGTAGAEGASTSSRVLSFGSAAGCCAEHIAQASTSPIQHLVLTRSLLLHTNPPLLLPVACSRSGLFPFDAYILRGVASSVTRDLKSAPSFGRLCRFSLRNSYNSLRF